MAYITVRAGNDYIDNYTGINPLIFGGTGDDYIVNGAASFVYVYQNGDGNDTISGFNENSTLSIAGAEYSSVKSSANITVTVGDGSITLIDAADNVPDDTAEENSLSMSIKINGEVFNVTLEDNDAARALKELLPLELNMNELNGNEKYFYLEDDLPTDSVNVGQIHAGDLMLYGSDCIVLFYKDFPTIYSYTRLGALDNPDGLAEILGDGNVNVTFAETAEADDAVDDSFDDAVDDSFDDAADDSVDDTADDSFDDAADDSVIDDTADDSVDDAADDSFDDTADDSIIDDAADDSVIDDTADDSVDDAADDTVDDAADDSVDDAADDSVIDDAADDTDDDITDIFRIDKWTDFFVNLKSRYRVVDGSKHKNPLEIIGNAFNNLLIGGKGNDTLDGTGGDNTLTGGKGNDLFVFSGGIGFITDYDKKDRIDIGSFAYADFAIDGKDLTFHFDYDNSLTIQNGADKLININSEVNFYTADGVLDKKKKSIKLSAEINSFNAAKMSKLELIDGSATGAIEITGNRKKNYIIAGAIGSTLDGSKGKDTLVGGDGADTFIYNKGDGKNVIEGYGEGDRINLDSKVEIKDVKTKRGDTILKFKGGSLTVKDTTEFTFSAEDSEMIYKDGVFIAGDTAKIYGSYKGAINLADNVNNFDGSEGKKKLTITGNDSANSLVGGKKNDKLWGGDGADTFIFQAGNGKDTIMDYSAAQGDLLTILDKKGEAGDFSKATFKNDTLTLNITGGGKVIFSGVDSDTSININGETKTISELIK